MEFLLFLQNLRNPALNALFLLITRLGEEIVVLTILLVQYWCLDKRTGLRIGLFYFAGSWLGQLLKLVFLVPRPFAADARLLPLEEAVGTATGYSFPSGHTCGAVSLAMGLGLSHKKRWLWICMGAYVILIGLSRMYLGVHTPVDVLGAILLTIPMCLLTEAVLRTLDRPEKARLYTALGVAAALGLMAFAAFRVRLTGVEVSQAADSFKTGGAALGLILGVYLERRFLCFDTKAKLWQQAAKLLAGTAIALGLKEGLKLLLGTGLGMQALRYFIVVLFVVYLWPALFTRVLRKG